MLLRLVGMEGKLKTIPHEKLFCMDSFAAECGYVVDLAYARNDNFLFGERIYRPEAQLWLYEDLARIVMRAAVIARDEYSIRFVLYDGLRTVDAQEKMLKTKRVEDNPHWLVEPRMLSVPGAGGHPRGMAVDIGLMDENGILLDMGCTFDDLTEVAHRQYAGLSAEVRRNRGVLDDCMARASTEAGVVVWPLPQEWWDFRLPPEVFNSYAPLRDADLPSHMRML